jgi:arabinogalactan oligomer/maltooligosaccharide transport system substrate-binding protein
MRKSFISLLLLASFTLFFLGCSKAVNKRPVTIYLWINEREADNGHQWIKEMETDFLTDNENIRIEVINKESKDLLEEFRTAALAGVPPDLLWTTSDYAIPFISAGLIQPVDAFINISQFIEPVNMYGQNWAIPISSGNHLMLMINKKYISNVPGNTDDFITAAKTNTKDDMFGLVYNLNEALWLAPWLGGFGGKVFADDGVTPTLDTPAMVNTLTFLKDLKFKHAVVPAEADYSIADTLFREGKAAMLINGDWSINRYKEALGENLMIGRLPRVSSTGKWPAPYTSGAYFMIPVDLSKEKVEAVKSFIAYVTSEEQQAVQLNRMYKLPGLKTALSNPLLTSDPLLKGSVAQMEVGTPTPIGLEIGTVMNAINSELTAVMNGTETPAEAANIMQETAEKGINKQK